MLRNMMNSLLTHETIKNHRPQSQGVAPRGRAHDSLAKTATVANRRLAFNRLRDRDVVVKLFDELGPALLTVLVVTHAF